MSSGEAVIYKLTKNDAPYVFKYYKLGYALSSEVLSKIKSNPKDKIVKLYEYGTHLGQDYEIMEFAEGGTLDDYLKENGSIKDMNTLKNFVGQIAEGLNQLHGQLRIIYQDLKPENIYFRDKARTSLILADFGISSVMPAGENMAEVKANATTIYAAPDLARIGAQTNVKVGPSVDYFALGITMMQLWMGEKPFQGLSDSERGRQIMYKEVEFPQDMDIDYKMLIQGLIDPLAKSRWGIQHVSRWLGGESLKSDYQKTSINYEKQMFTESESFSNPVELAELMEKHPKRGIPFLYNGLVSSWLEKADDRFLLEEIKNVMAAYSGDKEKDAGLYTAIYTLDPERSFVTQGGKKCTANSEIAEAILAESDYYMKELKNKNSYLYLYLIATGGPNGRIFIETVQKYFDEYSPKRALNLLYLKLQEDGGQSFTVGSKTYLSPDEAGAEKDAGQIALIKKAVQEQDSLFLVWLSDYFAEFFASTNEFKSLYPSDKFFLLSKMPFLSYKEMVPDWEEAALNDLSKLIYFNPGRFDLFETYAAQALPFTGRASRLDWQPTAIYNLASSYNEIIKDDKVGFELLNLLIKHGADVNEYSGDGSTPLFVAVRTRNVPLVKKLLESGANPSLPKTDGFPPILRALYYVTGIEDDEDKRNEEERIEITNILLDYNVDVNVSSDGMTPLMLLFYLKPCKELSELGSRILSKTSNVNQIDDIDKLPALYYAIIARDDKMEKKMDYVYYDEMIEMLLKAGAKTEILAKSGYTSPLMHAADTNDFPLAELLLKYGAKNEFADADGETAFVYAMKKKHKDIAQLVDPGKALLGKARLLSAGKAAICVLGILGMFLTMDVLARAILSFNFIYPVLLTSSILLSHLLFAYILILIMGLREYLLLLRGTFMFVSSILFYIFGIPILFPLVISGLQMLTRFLPDNITQILSIPASLMTQSNSGVSVLIGYLVFLAVFMTGSIFYTKFADKVGKVSRMYKAYAE
jgi:serine/threonine protein kinase/ankyrin repeat protein